MLGEKLQGLKLLDIEKKVHPFAIARLVETETLLDYLLEERILNPDNFKTGLIADLATGSGGGLLALRRKSSNFIIGVDNSETVPRVDDWAGQNINYYCGAGLKSPEKGVLEESATSFTKEDVINFLSRQSYNTYSLITMFYIGNFSVDYRAILEQCGFVLRPGGQLLITSDLNPVMLHAACEDPCANHFDKRLDIGKLAYDSSLGYYYPPRILPAKPDLINRFGGFEKLDQHCQGYFRKELRESIGRYIGLMRDRNFWVFTRLDS